MSKGKIGVRAGRFMREVYDVAKAQVKPEDSAQMVWFMRHAFRMGWNAAKQDSYTAKRKQEAQRAGVGGKQMGRKLITASDIAIRALSFVGLGALIIAAINSLKGCQIPYSSVFHDGLGLVVGMLLSRNLIDAYVDLQKRMGDGLKKAEEAEKARRESMTLPIIWSALAIVLHICLLAVNLLSPRSSGLTMVIVINIAGLVFHACRIVYLLRAAPKPRQSEMERVIYGGGR